DDTEIKAGVNIKDNKNNINLNEKPKNHNKKHDMTLYMSNDIDNSFNKHLRDKLKNETLENSLKKEQNPNNNNSSGERPPSKKLYKGMSSYNDVMVETENTSSTPKMKPKSFQNSAIKNTTVWDYKPDLCKDYKETGYCGYGDSCKFLHDRTDYKAGWQIEQEINDGVYCEEEDDKYIINSSESENSDFIDSDLCFICKEAFDDNIASVITKCGHKFHEKCALKSFKKTTKCIKCFQETQGIFTPA
ncbi:MAG: hypothetical protein MHPSP_002202, partial [Paramarteilia canceri]